MRYVLYEYFSYSTCSTLSNCVLCVCVCSLSTYIHTCILLPPNPVNVERQAQAHKREVNVHCIYHLHIYAYTCSTIHYPTLPPLPTSLMQLAVNDYNYYYYYYYYECITITYYDYDYNYV